MGVFTGTWTLLKLALRRDRVRLPIWIISIVGLTVMIAVSFPDIYPTAEERQARAVLMLNPATVALAGPGHGLEDYTFGAMMTNEMLSFTAIAVALMSVLLVVRHTRGEEESGSAELVRANAVGRYAQLTAALKEIVIANLLIALLTGVGLGVLGIESIGWEGSFLYGAALGMVGLFFGAVAAVTAQVTEHSRAAAGMAGVAIAVFYSLRAVGDAGDSALSWLSPFGWGHATKAYVDDTWLPILLGIAVSLAVMLFAYVLSTQRDVGGSLVAARRGRKQASPVLTAGPLGLAWRLQRMSVLWWSVGIFVFGAVYGSLVSEVEAFASELAISQDLFAMVQSETLIDSFIAFIFSLLAMTCAIYTLLAVAKMRSEEVVGRLEPVLATAVSRLRWAASHIVIVCIGTSILLLAGALGFGLSISATLESATIMEELLHTAIAYIPAVWLVGAFTFALFGLLPKAVHVAWVLIAYSMFIIMLGGLFGFPDWTLYLTPFGHMPLLPAEQYEAAPLLWLTGVTIVLLVIGFVGFRRRDIGTT